MRFKFSRYINEEWQSFIDECKYIYSFNCLLIIIRINKATDEQVLAFGRQYDLYEEKKSFDVLKYLCNISTHQLTQLTALALKCSIFTLANVFPTTNSNWANVFISQ